MIALLSDFVLKTKSTETLEYFSENFKQKRLCVYCLPIDTDLYLHFTMFIIQISDLQMLKLKQQRILKLSLSTIGFSTKKNTITHSIGFFYSTVRYQVSF